MSSQADEEHQHIETLRGVDGIHWQEKISGWVTTDSDALEDPTRSPESFHLEDEIDDEDYSISQFSEARKFLIESQAYQWLVERLQAELHLTSRTGRVLNEIRSQILRVLGANPIHSGYNINHNTAEFKLMWSPMDFLKRQFSSTPAPILGDIIVLNGTEVDAQCSTCRHYVQQIWGVMGTETLRGLQEGVAKGVIGETLEC